MTRSTPGETTCVAFAFTGSVQTWTVPEGVTSATFTLVGADGGDVTWETTPQSQGGRGARVEAVLPVAPGDALRVVVGGEGESTSDTVARNESAGGFNGGGDGRAGGGAGGGATDVRTSAGTLDARLLVAAGGGGAGFGLGEAFPLYGYGTGGDGGDSAAAGSPGGVASFEGDPVALGGEGGSPGTATAGGLGGHSGVFFPTDPAAGGPGSFGEGGDTAPEPDAASQPVDNGGGGGGGGWYGGGAGGYGAAAISGCAFCAGYAGGGGGGGGSSHVTDLATSRTTTQGDTSTDHRDGYAEIRYVVPDAVDDTKPSVTINQGATQADPTDDGPIVFDVEFSEPVAGFTAADVSVSGTAGATSAVVSGSGASYTASVPEPASAGTVVATIPAGVVQDEARNANTASTSTDNTVTYTVAPPSDTVPPTLSCQADPQVLRPADHELHPVTVVLSAADTGGSGLAGTTLTSVSSDQLSSDPLMSGWAIGTEDTSGSLRAEAYGQTRTYTLTYQATDNDGNSTDCTTTVRVGALDHLEVTPATGTAEVEEPFAYTATAVDTLGNEVVVTTDTVFSIDPDGGCTQHQCHGAETGTHTVTGSYADVSDTAQLDVVAVGTTPAPPTPDASADPRPRPPARGVAGTGDDLGRAGDNDGTGGDLDGAGDIDGTLANTGGPRALALTAGLILVVGGATSLLLHRRRQGTAWR